MIVGSAALVLLCSGPARCSYRAPGSDDTHNSFYTDEDRVETDYNLFDTFEGYTWHRYQHQSEDYK